MALDKTISTIQKNSTVNKVNQEAADLFSSGSTKSFINEALSRLVNIAKSTQDERDMEALGIILYYLDSLENTPIDSSQTPETNEVYLEMPVTLTL